jgi:hypothetical protein
MPDTDSPILLRIHHAQQALSHAGILDGAKDTRLTVRVQTRLLDEARRRTGISGETDLVTAGLTLLAARDDFGAWLATQKGTLTDDFEIGL